MGSSGKRAMFYPAILINDTDRPTEDTINITHPTDPVSIKHRGMMYFGS